MTNPDYIVIGAGSAGCVVAGRLTEDPAIKVMVIEAGASDSSILFKMPAGSFPLLRSGRGNWNYSTVPQKHMNGRQIWFPRGKVLGGSSSINAMVVSRGNSADYEEWERLGNTGWGYDDCLPYFKKLESYSEGDQTVRGRNGPINVCTVGYDKLRPLSHAWMQASLQAGHPYNPDSNGTDRLGTGFVQLNCTNGLRRSASSQYLRPAMERDNLTVVTGAHTNRLIFSNGRCVGVEVTQGRQTKQFFASREVILSAGAIGSPQILQLSGVGDPDHLRSVGVDVTHELPGVGKNLRDHLAVTVKQLLTKPLSMVGDLSIGAMGRSFANYVLFKRGAAAESALQVWTVMRSSDKVRGPDLQTFIVPLIYSDHGRQVVTEHGFTAVTGVCKPKSTGCVQIASADPAKAPLIDPNYLSHPDDMTAMIAAIRKSREIIAQEPFTEMRGAEYAPGADVTSDEDLASYIRAESNCFYHPVGTCKMGTGSSAVVDSRLRVRGIEGLRVIDASIMPTIVAGTTNFPTMMIGEKGVDMILEDNHAKSFAGVLEGT